MKRLDVDEEERRLRSVALRVTAELDQRPASSRPRSESRVEALVRLDRARIRRERETGLMVVEPGRVILL